MRAGRLLVRTFLPGAMTGLLACASSTQQAAAPDTIAPGRKVVLQESESLFVGRPFRYYVTANGSHVVTDDGSARVLWFSADGRLEFSVGQRGSGPGEFQAPGAVVMVDDSTVAIEDRRIAALKVLRIPSGQQVRSIYFPGAVADDYVVTGDTVWFATLAPRRGATPGVTLGMGSLVRWVVSDSAASAVWPGPAADLLSGTMSTPLGVLASQVIAIRDSIIYSKFGTRDILEARLRNGARIDAWQVPRKWRRGLDEGLMRFARDQRNWSDPQFGEDFWGQTRFSSDRRLGILQNGWLVLATVDGWVSGKVLNGTVMVTVLDLAGARACVDRVVPTNGVAWPRVTLHGDSLVTLTQELGTDDTIRLVATYFPMLPEACDWVPLEKAPSVDR